MSSEENTKSALFDRRLIVILLIVFVQMFGAAMVIPILPLQAARQFDMSASTITLLNTSFFAAQFIAGPFLGRLSDRYGRIPVLLLSQIGTVIAFLMLGFGNAIWILFAARIFDGITGGNLIVAQAYIADITPAKDRSTALGYLFAALGSGFVFGPAIAGFLANQFSYQTPYLFAALAAAIVVVMTYLILEETVTDEQKNTSKTDRAGGMNFRDIVGNVPLVGILLTTFGAQLAFAMMQSTLALFGDAVLFADNPEQAEVGVGILYAVFGIGQIVTQMFVMKPVVRRFGDGAVVLLGSVIRSVSMFVIAIWIFPVATGVSGFLFAMGTGLQLPALQSLTTETVSPKRRGQVMGLYQSSFSLSVIVGSAIAGVLFEITPTVPFYFGGVLFAVMILPSYALMQWHRGLKRDAEGNVMLAPAVGD